MKKTFLSLMIIGAAFAGYSQAKVEIGLKAGANVSNSAIESPDADFDSESLTAFHGGLYGLIKLANIGIQPEVLLSQQGAEVIASVPGFGTSSNESNLTYLNVPVMLKLYLPLGINFQAGPQFGVLVNAEDTDGEDIKDSFKNSDLSAAIGAGWDAPFGLQINARYILGLGNIAEDDDFSTEFKNRTFQISVGYSLFKLGR